MAEEALMTAAEVGRCVAINSGELFRGSAGELARALSSGQVAFHAGRIRGAWPSVLPAAD